MSRNDFLLGIRPHITIQLTEQKSEVELFMHRTLRPILKFQDVYVRNNIENHPFIHKIDLNVNDEVKKRENLKLFLAKNIALRNQLIGAMVGLFTDEELSFYLKNNKQTDKRIIEMVITRFLS